MRAWYVPTWTGDFRLEEILGVEGEPPSSMLTVENPTAGELAILTVFLSRAHDEGWILNKPELAPVGRSLIRLEASVARAGRVLASDCAPKAGALTAVKSRAGTMLAVVDLERQDEVIQQLEREAEEAAARAAALAEAEAAAEAAREAEEAKRKAEEATAAKAALAKKKADAAVTVRRPTMCCPHPVEGPLLRSSRVLREFCTPTQWRQWVEHGWLLARGRETGNTYRICHRHHPAARLQHRITFDLDHGATLHCYNWSVPPPEEVLGIKLVIEHREHWVRNPSGCVGRGAVFDNPFGYGGGDGIWDTGLLTGIGSNVEHLTRLLGTALMDDRAR